MNPYAYSINSKDIWNTKVRYEDQSDYYVFDSLDKCIKFLIDNDQSAAKLAAEQYILCHYQNKPSISLDISTHDFIKKIELNDRIKNKIKEEVEKEYQNKELEWKEQVFFEINSRIDELSYVWNEEVFENKN